LRQYNYSSRLTAGPIFAFGLNPRQPRRRRCWPTRARYHDEIMPDHAQNRLTLDKSA
jgi:hypothetical protein